MVVNERILPVTKIAASKFSRFLLVNSLLPLLHDKAAEESQLDVLLDIQVILLNEVEPVAIRCPAVCFEFLRQPVVEMVSNKLSYALLHFLLLRTTEDVRIKLLQLREAVLQVLVRFVSHPGVW